MISAANERRGTKKGRRIKKERRTKKKRKTMESATVEGKRLGRTRERRQEMRGMERERRGVGIAAKERTRDDINRGRDKRGGKCKTKHRASVD